MNITEAIHIMTEAYEKDPSLPHPCWIYVDAVPSGIIETQEQYDYIKYYSDNTSIGMDGIRSFEEDRGRYLNLSNYFGGAAFYFSTLSIEDAERYANLYPSLYSENCNWCWGKYGKIEFEK